MSNPKRFQDEGKFNGGRSNGRPPDDDAAAPNASAERAEGTDGAAGAADTRLFGVDPLDEALSIELIEDAHSLPGIYPVVVIAARDEEFREILLATVESEQDGDPFTITVRESSRGNFISYRVELHVESGRAALDRKAALAALEGVVTVL